MNKVSVIIPFLNEERNIPFLTERLSEYFSLHPEVEAEVLFVDDGSTDNSVELLKSASGRGYQSKIISLSKNFGSHAALRAGIMHAKGDHICLIYADLQDPLGLIGKMLEKCTKETLDICWASRESSENGLFERSFSKGYSYLMRKYAIASYPKEGFDVVMFRRNVQECLNQNVESNSSVFLQILMMGFTQGTIHYQKEARKLGKSKWTFRKKLKLLVDSFVAFSYAPIRFVTLAGFSLFFIGLLWTIYIIVRKLVYNDLESGWPAMISILTIGFGVTNISLGILAEYLWRTLDSSRKRPVFIIKDVFELSRNGN
jgi:glycosyltransferase involved in cell wall biosynthesis